MKSSFKRSFKTWHWVTISICAVTIVSLLANRGNQAQSGVSYTITDLGTFAGTPNQSHAYGINNCGTTVGDSNLGITNHPFYRQGVSKLDLGFNGTAFAVNGAGFTAGISSSPRAFVFHDNNGNGSVDAGEVQDIGALPGDDISSAGDINDNNQVVGISENSNPQSFSDRAFIWQNGVMQQVPAMNGITPANALGINNSGHVVGTAVGPWGGEPHAFFYNGSSIVELGTFGGGSSFGWKINNADYVVGSAALSGGGAGPPRHAFVWHDDNGNGIRDTTPTDEMRNLGTLGGDKSTAYDINSTGYVVGTSDVASDTHAFIWHDDNSDGQPTVGELKDLNTLVTDLAGWSVLQEARAINDGGQIVGWGTKSNGETHAFLLTPTGFTPPACPGASPSPSPTPTPIYSVSGQVKDGANMPVSGVLITFEMNFQGTPSTTTTLTDANGNYSSGDLGCKNNVKVTPSKAGLSFNPLSTVFVSTSCLNGTGTANFTASGSSPTPTPTPTPTPATTSLISVQGTGSYASTATLSATLYSNDMPVNGKTISFTLNSTAVCGGSTGITCPTTNASGVATLSGVSLSGLNVGNYPAAVGASFAGDASYGSASQTGLLTVTPVLLLESGTNNAAAVDSVTFVRGPFSVTNNSNFSSDHLTRIIIFTSPLANPEPTLKVFASGHELQVESFGLLPGLNVSYIVVKLDQVLMGSGPINYDLTVSLRGVTSNTATLTITP